jgi:hypothetical protein
MIKPPPQQENFDHEDRAPGALVALDGISVRNSGHRPPVRASRRDTFMITTM